MSPMRTKRFCTYPGCSAIVTTGRCNQHQQQYQKESDERRGSAYSRGYTSKWARYAKAFLLRPENALCKLNIDAGCKVFAECVDHIDPPSGAKDSRFWNPDNHQSACIHCNSVKSNKMMHGWVLKDDFF